VGILNAGVWFGGAVFFTFGAGLAPFSQEMKTLLGPNNYPYFSGAIAQILIARYFHFQLICGVIAVLHLLAEGLYLGKHPRKLQVALLIGLCATPPSIRRPRGPKSARPRLAPFGLGMACPR
jgi:hypothetical protein